MARRCPKWDRYLFDYYEFVLWSVAREYGLWTSTIICGGRYKSRLVCVARQAAIEILRRRVWIKRYPGKRAVRPDYAVSFDGKVDKGYEPLSNTQIAGLLNMDHSSIGWDRRLKPSQSQIDRIDKAAEYRFRQWYREKVSCSTQQSQDQSLSSQCTCGRSAETTTRTSE